MRLLADPRPLLKPLRAPGVAAETPTEEAPHLLLSVEAGLRPLLLVVRCVERFVIWFWLFRRLIIGVLRRVNSSVGRLWEELDFRNLAYSKALKTPANR